MSIDIEPYFVYGWFFEEDSFDEFFDTDDIGIIYEKLEKFDYKRWNNELLSCATYSEYSSGVVIGFYLPQGVIYKEFINHPAFKEGKAVELYKEIFGQLPSKEPEILCIENWA